MSPYLYLAPLVGALLTSLVAVPLVLRFALGRGLLDLPGGRKSHDVAVPRLGGVGILAGFLVGVALGSGTTRWLGWWNDDFGALLAGALIMFGVGLSDDLLHRPSGDSRREGLPAWLKLLLQFGAALVPMYAGVRISSFQILGEYQVLPAWLSYPLTLIWIAGITNALNFIDGVDGLAGGVSMIMVATLAIIAIGGPSSSVGTAVFALSLLGGVIGFLRYNFPPARIFMGDGGAYLLGYLLAMLAITGVMKGATTLAVLAPLVIMALPILNLAGVVVVRMLRGDSPMAADREHLHNRLQDSGWSDLSVLLFVYAVCGLCGSAALSLFGLARPSAALAGAVALLLVVVAARRSRDRS